MNVFSACTSAHQKQVSDPMVLYLKTVVATMWLLQIDLTTSDRVVNALNRWTISTAQIFNLLLIACVFTHVY